MIELYCCTCKKYKSRNLNACDDCQHTYVVGKPPSKYEGMFVENRNEGGKAVSSYCLTCERLKDKGSDICDFCEHSYITRSSMKKEEKKMIVTIIGSCSKSVEKMKECKEYFERFGHKVHCPSDPERERLALIVKQSDWIKRIEEADLVVAIPKEKSLTLEGNSSYILDFGESTSYEMAIALRFGKQIMFWD